jgi:hypothetical protein
MKAFLREYWLWIVIPIAIVLCALLVAVFLLGGEESSPFQYNIY